MLTKAKRLWLYFAFSIYFFAAQMAKAKIALALTH
jgi:hypothetical protein